MAYGAVSSDPSEYSVRTRCVQNLIVYLDGHPDACDGWY